MRDIARPIGYAVGVSEVTQILQAIEAGDAQAAEQLLPLVYDELRQLAHAQLAREKPGHTLDATALVHEVYLRLVKASVEPSGRRDSNESDASALRLDARLGLANCRHFFAAAAEAMRRILVEHARARNAAKRGGRWNRVELADWHRQPQAPEQVLALNEAVERLAAAEPRKAQLVTLRFFGGLTMPEAAAALNISLPTAERWWTFARSWLYAELAEDEENSHTS